MATRLVVDEARLWRRLMRSAEIGAVGATGLGRLALSDDDRSVRDWFVTEAEALGCWVQVDAAGNIFAGYPGSRPDLPPIAMGSHLDSQPTGGRFDGVLGVLAGLEVVQSLAEHGVRTRHPLVVVDWTNEEGCRFAPAMTGSGAFAGRFALDYVYGLTDRSGKRFDEELVRIGYKGSALAAPQRFAGYFELHIEQGPVLETEGLEIGVVTGVQGMRWFDVEFSGDCCHAGTTPMALRRDPVPAVAAFLAEVNAIGDMDRGRSLCTVGLLEAAPGSRNTVPQSVRLSVDLRHPDDGMLDRMEARLVEVGAEMAGRFNIDHAIARRWNSPPVTFDARAVAAVSGAVRKLCLSHREMVSGAGHDAVHVAAVAPTAMIFVPCQGGISHNPRESITSGQAASGANVLLQALLDYDEMETP